jgi:D-beta-D-heptose 7-phosphate kinase/D-beta-D-heptose 1-phosphate adenosyltransferase
MTNGCFDIIHAGHVAYLEQAKALGSRLVVALNTDASVARIKGAGRPINNLADRMAIVGSLASVDWVISFDEDDPNLLVKALSPDVLVKGGDYEADEIAGGTHVLATGGEVRVLPFIGGFSTTAIIEKLVGKQAAKATKQ